MGVVLILCSQQVNNPTTAAFRPGWYIGANGGVNVYVAEGNNFLNPNKDYYFSLNDNLGSMGRIVVGYDFTPVFGVRGLLGSAFHYWPDIRFKNPNGSYKIEAFGAQNLTGDLMLNISNWWGGYNPTRLINVSLFAGGGFVHRDKSNFSNDWITASGRGGMQADFRLSHALDLNLIAEVNVLGDNYNDYITSLPIDIYGGVTVGFTYHFGETSLKSIVSGGEPTEPLLTQIEAKPVVDVETVPATEPTPEPVLEAVQLANVEPAPVQVTEVLAVTPAPTVQSNPVMNSNSELWVNVFYPLNQQGIVNRSQKAAIAKVVDYLSRNPQAKIVVRGYADRGTGTGTANKYVSRKRALNVAYLLKTEYAIPAHRIHTISYGSRVQLYKQQNMNRLTSISSVGSQPFKNTTVFNDDPTPMQVAPANNIVIAEDKNSAKQPSDLKVEIFFTDNKEVVAEAKQEALIMKAALFLRRNPASSIVISGYADKTVGTMEQNNLLSKKRAISVSNALILKYSIKADRIQVKWFGAGVQPYSESAKNRLVAITLVPKN